MAFAGVPWSAAAVIPNVPGSSSGALWPPSVATLTSPEVRPAGTVTLRAESVWLSGETESAPGKITTVDPIRKPLPSMLATTPGSRICPSGTVSVARVGTTWRKVVAGKGSASPSARSWTGPVTAVVGTRTWAWVPSTFGFSRKASTSVSFPAASVEAKTPRSEVERPSPVTVII